MNGRLWTPEEDQYLRDNYPDGLGTEIARHLGRSLCSLYGRVNLLGLKKSEVFKLSDFSGRLNGVQGRHTQFQKGNVPANKGKKMKIEQYEKCKDTMFKAGHIPMQHKPVGSITIRNNYKRGSSYMYIKIGETNVWKLLHRYVWENAHGLVLKGMNVVFKDDNFKNCDLSNLELISDAENMMRNTIHARYTGELKKTILTLGQLKRKIRTYGEK